LVRHAAPVILRKCPVTLIADEHGGTGIRRRTCDVFREDSRL